MRWLVEVSSLGKTDFQKFCVEAESWQRALQAARSQRGEDGPMSGFSIELLEEGYRAVDPLARVRFVVKRAPDDMPVTVTSKDTKAAAGTPASKGKSPSVAPPPAGPAPGAPHSGAFGPSSGSNDPTTPNLPPSPSSSAKDASATGGNRGAPRPVTSAAGAPAAPAPADGKKKNATMVFSSSGEAAVADQSVERAAPPAIGSPVPGLPAVKLLTSREQNPNDASPLTYREYAFAVAEGTSEDAAVEVLRAQLRYVEAHIATAKTGKLVNLAVFDLEFTGKPPKPPLATLTWKDWKGEPVVGYPRRGGASRPPRPPTKDAGQPLNAPPAASAPPTGQQSPPAPPGRAPDFTQTQPHPAPPVPAAQPQAASAMAANDALSRGPSTAPMMPVAAPSSPSFPDAHAQAQGAPGTPPQQRHAPVAQAPNHANPFPHQQPVPAPTFTEAEAPRAKLPSQPPGGGASGMVKTPSGRFVRGRVSGDELITSLFESMHDLHFLRDALDGGQFCLALATEVLPSRAALIHFFDIEKREWVVACTRGKDTHRLLTMRTADTDEYLRECARKRRALVVANAASAAADRYRQLNGARSLIVAPIMQAGRALGALEIINPLDGMPFTEDEGNAMTYIAEQYAEYLGSRGIVLDRERIQSAARA